MKRITTTALLLAGALLFTLPAFADDDDTRGYGPRPSYGMGPGMMGGGHMGGGMMGGGMGYGMMGGGMGPGMMGMDPVAMHPELAQLPAEKQEQLRKLHLSMMQAMIQKRADLQVKALSLGETMRAFPLDQGAARKQWAEMNKARQELFELRVNMMAQVQQIVGEELWTQMHRRGPYGMHGHGPGAVGPRGPGMMGPGAGTGPGMMGQPAR